MAKSNSKLEAAKLRMETALTNNETALASAKKSFEQAKNAVKSILRAKKPVPAKIKNDLTYFNSRVARLTDNSNKMMQLSQARQAEIDNKHFLEFMEGFAEYIKIESDAKWSETPEAAVNRRGDAMLTTVEVVQKYLDAIQDANTSIAAGIDELMASGAEEESVDDLMAKLERELDEEQEGSRIRRRNDNNNNGDSSGDPIVAEFEKVLDKDDPDLMELKKLASPPKKPPVIGVAASTIKTSTPRKQQPPQKTSELTAVLG